MKKCLDVSAWQGEISANAFKKTEVPCVVIRASYTLQKSFSLHKDKDFDNNIKTAHSANLRLGAYHYSQAISEIEAEKEADFIIGVLKPYKKWISLPIAFDWEFGGRLNSHTAGKMGKQRCKQICDAFCRKIRAAGYTPMVYANLSTLNGYIASDIWKYWLIWVAQYNSKCTYKHPYYMWQYTSSAKVKGISGKVDMNNLYGYTQPHELTTYQGELPVLPHRGWFASGDTGEQVKRLQKFLNWYGGYGLDVDGEVGRKTINAVREYEGREKLKVDGAFGEQCLARAKVVKA